ncbi:MAG TPA: hypothetical protein VNZ49_04290 [Bacteroidia bacterium]|jgi:hypothetical protein|nr:hypothetical protein [Bacteroidia bacterium]
MKKFISLVLIFTTLNALSQNYSELKSIKLDDSLQCKNAEKKVLECSDYLLSTPCVENLKNLNACQFIIEWMEKTPDYTFGFDDAVYKSIKSDVILSGVYLASQSKIAIVEKPRSTDINFKIKYVKMFLEYCEKPENKVKLSSKIKKLIAAKNEGKLKEALSK